MTSEATVLQLSDDEAVAIAVSAGVVWPGLLPTVNVTSEQVLTAAALRGLRSLAIRGLLNATGAPAERLNAPLYSRVVARTYIARELVWPADGALVSSFYATDSGVVAIDVTDSAGVHTMGDLSEAEALELVSTSIREAVVTSQTEGAAGLSWCVLLPLEDGSASAIVVTSGEIAPYAMSADGGLTKQADPNVESIIGTAFQARQ